MNFSEILIIMEDEIFRGSKSRYIWFFGGVFIFELIPKPVLFPHQ